MQKTVLITGGSSGIGYELAQVFGHNNYNLILVANDKNKLQIAENKLKSHGFSVRTVSMDLADPQSPTKIYEYLQKEEIRIDILVNNAGFATYGEFAEIDLDRELSELQVNIVALTHLTKLFLPDMLKAKNGKVLNVASTAAFAPGPFMAVYYASKAYVLSFSQALNSELENTGVHVTALCPGPTDTGFVKRGGIENSKLFHGKNLTASSVANAAYDGLMKNKLIVVPGFRDKLMIQALRLAPRDFVLKVVKNIQTTRLRT